MTSSIEQPAIELDGVKVFAERRQSLVIGRVEFPYPADRDPIPINYAGCHAHACVGMGHLDPIYPHCINSP